MAIAIISYNQLSSLIKRINYQPPAEVGIKIVDVLLEGALAVAKSMEEQGEADVFVPAGANRSFLSTHLTTPLVEITVTGFDLLLALTKVENCDRAGVITYGHKLPYVDQIVDTITIKLHQMTFHSVRELDGALQQLLDQGITHVIGGSLVIERARQKGMHGIFIYSEDGVCRALDAAVEIALAKKAEAEKAETLRTIIYFAHEGIIATDKQGIITVFNPSAGKITKMSCASMLGTHVGKVIPSTRLHHVLMDGKSELGQLQSIGDAKILTNRIPIMTKGEITGAVATFQDVSVIQRAEENIRKRLYDKGFTAKNTFADIARHSKGIIDSKLEAQKYARTESTILILGESGTGKEMFAQAIHNESPRRKHPFVTINCAALPLSLLESELFGYAEGAFTGAKKGGKAGLFELAHSGSIFLDEIGEMPLEIQSRLLRVLQEHEVLRIGGERIVPVNIRVIAATNKNLWQMVQEGKFREDLYYRISVLELHMR